VNEREKNNSNDIDVIISHVNAMNEWSSFVRKFRLCNMNRNFPSSWLVHDRIIARIVKSLQIYQVCNSWELIIIPVLHNRCYKKEACSATRGIRFVRTACTFCAQYLLSLQCPNIYLSFFKYKNFGKFRITRTIYNNNCLFFI